MSRLLQLRQQFLTLQQRERMIILFAGVLIPLAIGFLLFIEPGFKAAAEQKRALVNAERQIQELQSQIALTEAKLSEDPNAPYMQRLTALEQQLAKVQQSVEGQTTDLVNAKQMPMVLRQLLGASDKVQLVSLQSLSPVQIKLDEQNTASDEQRNVLTENISADDTLTLYQHGVAMQLQGRYFDIQQYLAKVKDLPWKIYWHKFDYHTADYPNAVVSLELYTISTNQSFLGL